MLFTAVVFVCGIAVGVVGALCGRILVQAKRDIVQTLGKEFDDLTKGK